MSEDHKHGCYGLQEEGLAKLDHRMRNVWFGRNERLNFLLCMPAL
ncbi:hypothetical protein GGQ82_004130 [Sphingobium olei]